MTAAKNSKDTYLTEHKGHKIMVIRTRNGKGYSPYELLAAGKVDEAAQIAASAFSAGL